MKRRTRSIIVASTILTALVGVHLQGSIVSDRGSRTLAHRPLPHPAVARATDRAPGGRNRLVYVIAGRTLQFGALDLSNGMFLPIGHGLPPDAGGGLVQGLGTSLLTLTFRGYLDAIDPFTGSWSEVGKTGLGDCSAPGSYDPNCANVMGRLGGKFYATDFANNLYSVDPATGAATLIGPTGMPEVTVAPSATTPTARSISSVRISSVPTAGSMRISPLGRLMG